MALPPEDLVWGKWEPVDSTQFRQARDRISGHVKYVQLHHQDGPVKHLNGVQLSEADVRRLFSTTSTPRSIPATRSHHYPSHGQRHTSFQLSSSTYPHQSAAGGPRTSNSSLSYHNIAQGAHGTSRAPQHPIHRSGQVLFPRSDETSADTDGPGQVRSVESERRLPVSTAANDDLMVDPSHTNRPFSGRGTINIGGKQVTLLSPGQAPPAEAKQICRENGYAYCYDRHQELIAVAALAVEVPEQRDHVDEAGDILGDMRLNDEHPPRRRGSRNSDMTAGTPNSVVSELRERSERKRAGSKGKIDTIGENTRRPESELKRRLSNPPISHYAKGLKDYKHIKAIGSGQQESLDKRFQVRKSKFFKEGTVFAMLWHESHTRTAKYTNPGEEAAHQYTEGRFGVPIYTTIRRMVVLKEAPGYCHCSPIASYGRQGVDKEGIPRSEVKLHTAVYMEGDRPHIEDTEREKGMDKQPIAVRASAPDQKLLPFSRLNFGKIYTVEHNVKVMDVGVIRGDHFQNLMLYYNNTFSRTR